MGLFKRLKVGLGMARRSGRVLGANPKLFVFPLAGGVSGIAFMLTLFGSLFLTGPLLQDPGPALFGALFVAYLVETFVASFFTAALVAATRTVLRGGEPSVRAAMATAWRRKLPLLVWSVVAAVVGTLVKAVESQDNVVAELLAGLFALAWGVMTYFVVPVIVFRNPSVTGMFQESASIFKNTWGESLGAMGAVDIVAFLLALAGIALGGVTYVLTAGLGTLQLLLAVLVGGSAFLVGLLLGKALNGVAKTALYLYATERTSPEYFGDMDFSRLGGDGTGAAGTDIPETSGRADR